MAGVVIPQYVDITAAGRILGITRQRTLQLHNAGKLPSPDAFVGKHPLWLESSFMAFAKQRIAILQNTPVGHRPKVLI